MELGQSGETLETVLSIVDAELRPEPEVVLTPSRQMEEKTVMAPILIPHIAISTSALVTLRLCLAHAYYCYIYN